MQTYKKEFLNNRHNALQTCFPYHLQVFLNLWKGTSYKRSPYFVTPEKLIHLSKRIVLIF